MKRLLFLIALLFSVVCFANPPDEVKVFKPDKTFVAQDNNCICCDVILQAATAEEEKTYRPPVNKKNKPVGFRVPDKILVWEVAYPLKISVPIECEKAKQSMELPDVEFTDGVITHAICSKNYNKLNKTFKKNNQHTNYGYPLSGNRQHGKIFFS